MNTGSGISNREIDRRIRATNYLVVAQLFLQDNFLLSRPLTFDDIKPRLLGHWGTCPGLNIIYANLKAYFGPYAAPLDASSSDYGTHSVSSSDPNARSASSQKSSNFSIVIGPGHGFPALQANLFYDGELEKVDKNATPDEQGIAYLCKNFSWPGGFPSHASPITPGVICEGGELGYSLATAYGYALGEPKKTVAVVIGDGEFETATTLASLNLVKLLATRANGRVLPILHLNGYKISAPTIAARKSERELNQLLRGFGFTPLTLDNPTSDEFQNALATAETTFLTKTPPFLILKTEKGLSGPSELNGEKISGNFLAHQIPLKNPKTDRKELDLLETWLRSYNFPELFDKEKGFIK